MLNFRGVDVFVEDFILQCLKSPKKLQMVLMEIDQSDDGDSIHFLNLQMYRTCSDIYTPEF